MVLQMSQKQILIKLMTAIPRFQWNTPDTDLQGDWGLPQREKYRCGQESCTGIFAFVYTKALLANLCNPTIVLFWPCYRTQTNHLRNRIFSDKIKCMILIICDLNWNERYYNGRKLQKTVETLD